MKSKINAIALGTEKIGTVNFFSNQHNFGYITLEGTKTAIFVHLSHLIDIINENDRVVFDIIEGVKGAIATKVRRLA